MVTPALPLHGAWRGAWCWEKYFMPWFAAQGFAVHALSLRGHGGSDGAREIILAWLETLEKSSAL